MESKVKEYQVMYDQFKGIYEQVLQAEDSIHEIKKEIKQLKGGQKKVDYNNLDVVVGYMEKYIDESIVKEKSTIQSEVNESMTEIANSSGRVKKSFDKVVKWLSRAKVDKYLYSVDIESAAYDSMSKGKKTVPFIIFTTLNTVLAFVFRFDFLRFLPKVLRVIAGIIFWTVFLMPKIWSKAYNKFGVIYSKKFLDISRHEYEALSTQFMKDVVTFCVTIMIVIMVAIVTINIVTYVLARRSAKKFLAANKVVCLAIIDPNTLKQKMYDVAITRYMRGTVAGWKDEIEYIKKNGLSKDLKSDSLINLIRRDLCQKYNLLWKKMDNCNLEIEELHKRGEQASAELKAIIPKLNEKEKEVDSLVADSNHNNAVLSPYVSAGYSQYTIKGVKELIYFEHNCKPILICYNDDTAKEGERFRKNIAKLIELFMSGFFQENYHAYMNMWLVDFEGLYFPESRTKGLIKVIRTQEGVQQMFDKLKETRESVDSLVNGKISNINPIRLEKRENPIKYNIAFFVGHDFTTVDREVSQLFVGGENFGFLPIVFMKKSGAQMMINDDGSTRTFSRVIEKMKDNNQIYEFEGIVSEFEFDLMVSNQRSLLDENVCVKKIMSMDEFISAAESEEGLDVTNVLYLDTYQLSEDLYEAIKEMDYVKLFTINGEIPKFVTESVIKL